MPSFYALRPLNEDLQSIALKELHEHQIDENLDILKKWLVQSRHINARIDDQFLIAFLRGCKYSLERAKSKIDKFYTYRNHIPEIGGNRDPLEGAVNHMIKLGLTLPLPSTESPGSPRIILCRFPNNQQQFPFADMVKVLSMVTDVLIMEDDNSVVSGHLYVIDSATMSMGHVMQLHPAFLKKAIMIWEESSPIRQKGVHYVNTPKFFGQFFDVMKTLLSEKIRKRLFVHSSVESLYSVIPRKILPKEYGGETGTIQSLTDQWEEKLLSYREYFLDDNAKYGVDDRQRIGGTKNPLLGIDGTFKKLEID